MGYYVETGTTHGKADEILKAHPLDAREVRILEAREAVESGEGVIVVMNNGPFEAAGFAFNMQEFEEFTDPFDPRPKRYIVMPYPKAAELSGFRT